MKNLKLLKSWLIGIGMLVLNVGVSFLQIFRPERCTGVCGSCGMACVEPVVGLLGIGFVTVFFKKIKKKLKMLRLHRT